MEGIVAVLKPPAMSSNDVVVDIRKVFGIKRVGHLGTLDPEAAGVLPVCVGRAVRLFDYLVDKQKEYLAEISFGIATNTQDAQGTVTERCDTIIRSEQLTAVLSQFLGSGEQIAPMYSALKYNGKKLYDLARSGTEIPEKRREIVIDSIQLIAQTAPNRFLIRVKCSRGTYIRTLCADIGSALNVPSHMSFLLRTSSGPFDLNRSFTIPELYRLKEANRLSDSLTSCEDALQFMPACVLHPDRLRPSLNGLETNLNRPVRGFVRLYAADRFLGIGRSSEGSVKLIVNLLENDSDFR